jgi:hypothetical protein
VGEAHRRYTNFINARGRWTGHLFQSRFASVAMDELHLISAVFYVSLNPVRARLVARAEDWPWSSVRAHLNGVDDKNLVTDGSGILENTTSCPPVFGLRGKEARRSIFSRLATPTINLSLR